LENLTGYVTQYKEGETKRTKLRRVSKPLSIAASVGGIDRALEIEHELAALRAQHSGWKSIQTTMAETAGKCGLLSDALVTIDNELDKAYRELENCPACGQELSSEDAKAHLLGEVLV
jgi:hypothetical protein